MNWQQKKDLTYALLRSPTSMGDRQTRQIIVELLPLQIKIRIRRSDRDFDDVLNIVSTCSVFADGLQELQEIVREFDGGTDQIIAIDKIFADILLPLQSTPSKTGKDTPHPKNDSEQTRTAPSKAPLLQGRYQIFARKSTNSGEEYIALDKLRGIRVTLQAVSLQTPLGIGNFKEMARRLSHLSHSHLAKVIDDFVIQEGEYHGQYLVTEFVEGETLEERMQRLSTPFSERDALIYVKQACQAVQYLHNQLPPIVHRDISPQHIKIHQGRAVLTNLGVAALYTQKFANVNEQSHTNTIVNAGYTPIEQYDGAADAVPSSDIYALGATLYYLVTTKTPPDSMQRLRSELSDPQPKKFNRKISSPLDKAITSALELEARKRPQTITEWLQILENILYKDDFKYFGLCNQLQSYLEAEMWEEADQETIKVIFEEVKQQRAGQPGPISKYLPHTLLEVINNHWERYSEGRFGFRVQLEIWQEVAEKDTKTFDTSDFREFSSRVGWNVNNRWLDYHQFTLTLDAPEGHLPSLKDKENTKSSSFIEWINNVKEVLTLTENYLIK